MDKQLEERRDEKCPTLPVVEIFKVLLWMEITASNALSCMMCPPPLQRPNPHKRLQGKGAVRLRWNMGSGGWLCIIAERSGELTFISGNSTAWASGPTTVLHNCFGI